MEFQNGTMAYVELRIPLYIPVNQKENATQEINEYIKNITLIEGDIHKKTGGACPFTFSNIKHKLIEVVSPYDL